MLHGTVGVKVFATTGIEDLAKQVEAELRVRLDGGYSVLRGKAEISKFSNENIEVQVDNVREHIAVVLHSQTPPVNDRLIQLFAMLDAINNAHPKQTFVVFPYMPYSRSDRKNKPRISVMGQRVPEILNHVLGVRRVLLLEPHDAHIKQYFVPTADEVPAVPLLAKHIQDNYLSQWPKSKCTIVFADAGAAKRFEDVPSALGLEPTYIYKSRTDNTESPVIRGVTGNVKGKHCFLLDDEILTGGTAIKDAEALVEAGSASVRLLAVHGILSDQRLSQSKLMEKLVASCIDEIVVTDSVPVGDKAKLAEGKLTVIPIAPLLGEAVSRLITGESLSVLHSLDGFCLS